MTGLGVGVVLVGPLILAPLGMLRTGGASDSIYASVASIGASDKASFKHLNDLRPGMDKWTA